MPHKRGSDDWRLRTGHIAPTVWDHGEEYRKMLPAGVKPVAVTLGALSFDRDNMAEVRAQRRDAAQLLEKKDADCIVAGGVPVSTLDGPEAEEQFIEEISSDLSVPFTTSSRCAVDALRELDITKMVLVTPFPDERDNDLVMYFEAYGIDIVAIGGPSVPEPHDVRSMPDTAFYQDTRETLSNVAQDFDGVYVPCVPYGSVSHIEILEADIQRPVVISGQAQTWKALRMGGIDTRIDGYGQLLEQ